MATGWGDVEQEEWTCPVCLVGNDLDAYVCVSCEAARPGFEHKVEKQNDDSEDFTLPIPTKHAEFGSNNAGADFDFSAPSTKNKDIGDTKPGVDFFGTGTTEKGGEEKEIDFFGASAPATKNDNTANDFDFGAPASAGADTKATEDFDFGSSTAGEATTGDFDFGDASATAPKTNTDFDFGSTSTPVQSKKRGREDMETPPASNDNTVDIDDSISSAKRAKKTPTRFIKPYYTPRKGERVGASNSGQLYTFGRGGEDQLGHGKVDEQAVDPTTGESEEQMEGKPRQVRQLRDVQIAHVSCGGAHTSIITDDGVIYTWGCNDEKALGYQPPTEKESLVAFYTEHAADRLPKVDDTLKRYAGHYGTLCARLNKKYDWHPPGTCVPAKLTLPGGQRAAQIECGDSNTVALTSDGDVYSWGTYRDGNGPLGFDYKSTDKRHQQVEPLLIPNLRKQHGEVDQIANGANHTCVLTTSGHILTWGDGTHGQLARLVPARLKRFGLRIHPVSFPRTDRTVTNVFCGNHTTFAVTSNGTAYCWGLNNCGQLGVGDLVNRMKPTRMLLEEDQVAVQIAGGLHHSLVLTKDGYVYSMGRGDIGALGHPPTHTIHKTGNPTPERIVAFNDHPIRRIACGMVMCIALAHDGGVYTWGFGMEGYALGHGDGIETINEPRLVNLPAGATAVDVDAGGTHTAIICNFSKTNTASEASPATAATSSTS